MDERSYSSRHRGGIVSLENIAPNGNAHSAHTECGVDTFQHNSFTSFIGSTENNGGDIATYGHLLKPLGVGDFHPIRT